MPSVVYRLFHPTVAPFTLRIRAQSKFTFEKVLLPVLSYGKPNGDRNTNEPKKTEPEKKRETSPAIAAHGVDETDTEPDKESEYLWFGFGRSDEAAVGETGEAAEF